MQKSYWGSWKKLMLIERLMQLQPMIQVPALTQSAKYDFPYQGANKKGKRRYFRQVGAGRPCRKLAGSGYAKQQQAEKNGRRINQ